ncbi:hypothetical protein CsatB_025204 [Cannabis sativa]
MASHNVIMRQSHDLSFGANQSLGLGHNQHVGGVTHDQNLDLAHSHHDNELDIVHDHDHGLALGRLNEDEMAATHEHMKNLQANNLDTEGSNNYEPEQDHIDDVNEHDDRLSINVDTHELGLSVNHELTVGGESHDFHESMSISEDQLQEMNIVSSSDIDLHHSQMIVSEPVSQSRALVVAPNYELSVGQEFSDVQSCRRALRDAAIALRFEMQTVKSDKTRFTAKCASEGCPWRIHAAKLPGVPTFTIRTIHEEHNCGGVAHLGHQQASVQWVADSVEQRLRENPECKPKEILEEIHRVHGITLSYKQAWRGKERFMAALRGSFEEDYRLLPQYCEQIRRTNPGSIALVYGNPADNCFQRLFISFQASIYGFLNACRPLIGLDRTHLKSKYLGTVLFATGFDGDGATFPLAFGVVDEENDDNWMWFLSELHILLEINVENMPRLTILSDRQKGIVEGVEANFPAAFHGFCLNFLSDSFQKEFNDSMLINLLWQAAYALTVMEFEAKIIEIEEISQEAAYWIRRVPPYLWATAYFKGTRLGHMTSNSAESLNSWILEASGLPIIQMMECVRRQLMTWFNERRELSMQWTGTLVPSAEKLVSDAIERANSCHVIKEDDAKFEVLSLEGEHVVDIRTRCCTCCGWQLSGLPCAHAVAALLSCRQNVHRFTENYFTVANYRKAYSQTIHPIPDKTLWKETPLDLDSLNGGDLVEAKVIINPPKSLKPPAQPRKKRVRTEDGGRMKRVVHCSRCNQTGHFRSTCTAPI